MYDKSFFDRVIVILRTTKSYNTLCYMYDKMHFDREIVQLHTIYKNIISYAYLKYIKAFDQYLHICKMKALEIYVHILSAIQILIFEINNKAIPIHKREFIIWLGLIYD